MPFAPETRRTFTIFAIWGSPLIVELIRAITLGWFPTFDIGFLQLRAFDVGTSRTPLVGMPSTISLATGETTFHPGPLASWLSAIPVRALSFTPQVLLLTTVLINLVWLFLAAWMVARKISHVGVAVVAGSIALVGLGPEILHDPWNPHAAVLPLAIALLAMVFVLGGDRRWSVIAIIAGSFAAQSHLSFTAASAVAIVVGLVGVTRRPRSMRETVTAWSAFALCWMGPVIDQLFGGGNLLRLLSAGGEGSALGWSEAWNRFVRMAMPWRLMFDRSVDAADLVAYVRPIEHVLAVLVLVGAFALFVHHRDHGWGRGGSVMLGIIFLQLVVTSFTPMTLSSLFGVHVARSWWPVMWMFWLCIAATVSRPIVVRTAVRSVMVGVVASSSILLAATFEKSDLRDGEWFDATHEVADEIADVIPSGAYDLEVVGTGYETPLPVGVMADLVRRGIDLRVVGPVTAGLVHRDRIADLGDGRSRLLLVIDDGSSNVERPAGPPIVRIRADVKGDPVSVEVWID